MRHPNTLAKSILVTVLLGLATTARAESPDYPNKAPGRTLYTNTPTSGVVSSTADQDWFAFTTNKPFTVHRASGTVACTVYSSSSVGSSLTLTNLGSCNTPKSITPSSHGGTYQIKISKPTGSTPASYTLKWWIR